MVEAAGSLYALALLDFGSDGTGRRGPSGAPGGGGRAVRFVLLHLLQLPVPCSDTASFVLPF